MNEKETNISILMPSRERFKYLRRSLFSLDILSHYPEKIEYLIWIDNDDQESIEKLKKIKEQIPNIRIFVCPRMGYSNIWFMLKHLIEHSKGKIILPFADDCFMREFEWDKKMMEYAEEEVFIGCKTRFGFTKKLLNKIDVSQMFKEKYNKVNEFVRDNYSKNNLMRPMRAEWFGVELVRPNIRFKSRRDEEKIIPDYFNLLEYEQ